MRAQAALSGNSSETLAALEEWLVAAGIIQEHQFAAAASSERRTVLLLCHQISKQSCPVLLDEVSTSYTT